VFIPLLVLRNALRHKLRTLLTVVGIVVAIVAFGLLRTIVDAWYAGVNARSVDRGDLLDRRDHRRDDHDVRECRVAHRRDRHDARARLLALAMGSVGGFLPAARAARMKIVDALPAA
jgi:hypothetical protein